MQAIWDWAFANDGCIVTCADSKILILPGDDVRVFSDRHQAWFDDGVVDATFRDGIRVSYGFDRYFGFAMSRGNTKYLAQSLIPTKVKLIARRVIPPVD
jgi:hypothetical protein